MNSLQSYMMLLYRKAVHPEFFGIEGRRRIEHAGMEAEGWIFRGGHAIRFQHEGLCLCEVVSDQVTSLPGGGLGASLPCAGERDHQETLSERVSYMTTIQTETLSEHLYLGTYKEMLNHGREHGSLLSLWTDGSGKPNLSVVDLQRYSGEIHVQAYHLRSDCTMVLRTQSMFQVAKAKTPAPIKA
ncbi:MAG: DUF2617 family protein [Phycisphaerales bacterium]|nr:DUF2617 family protein [Phycisphaerales bacterium]